MVDNDVETAVSMACYWRRLDLDIREGIVKAEAETE